MEAKTFIYSNAIDTSYKITYPDDYLYVDSYPIISGNKYICDDGYHILSKSGDGEIKFNESIVKFEKTSNTPTVLQALGTNNASFSVLETNPKLTGNIKVVIDSNENIFIDTFKVNDTLSKKKYRKVAVSYKDYYGKNVMSTFRNMSSDDLYNIPKKYYDIVTTTTTSNEQYVDTYRSGVSTNSDNLYKENFSALAPLYIKDILPDFFVIFKVDGLVDLSDSKSIMKYLIENGKQIKCFDLRLNSKLGTYIRNIQRNADKFGDELYVSKTLNNSHQLTGISVENGVVTNIYESLTENSDYNIIDASVQNSNIDYLNHFSTLFESNKLVSDRLINFEYMFDDNSDVEQFELNTYYGLYLYTNTLTDSIYPYGKTDSGYLFKNFNAEDTELSTALDSSTIDKKQLIYGYTSDDWFRRIENNDTSILDDIINKPGKNILYTDGKRASINNYLSFFTLTLKETLQAGEHIKIIFHNSSSSLEFNSIIYEIIFSDDTLYKDSILSNHIVTYNTDYKTISHRISCYVKDTDDIATQIKYIYNALNEINDGVLYIPSRTSDSLSICQIGNADYDVYFQYIAKNNSVEKADKLLYFSYYSPELFVLNPLASINFSKNYECFLPIDFELLGERATSITKFVKIDSYSTPFEISTSISSDSHYLTDKLLISIDTSLNKSIKSLRQFTLSNITLDGSTWKSEDASINVMNSFNNIKNNILLLDSSLICQSDQIDIYLYKPYYVNYVVCGILNTKQLDSYPEEDEFKQYNFNRLKTIYNNIDSDTVSYNYCTISPLVSSKYNWVANASKNVSTQIMLSIDNSLNSSIIIDKSNNISSKQDYRTDLLNNNINISDFIYTLSSDFNILPLKTYFINNSTVEFVYNNAKYQLFSNNIELLSGKELANCDIYMCNSINYSNKNEWEIFIDKHNKDILILHYINNNAQSVSITKVNGGTNEQKSIIKFDINESLFDLNIANDASSSLSITSSNVIDTSIYTNDTIILYSTNITIIGKVSAKTGNNILLKNIRISNSGFEENNEITSIGRNSALNQFHINTSFECFLIQDNSVNAKNIENYENNADISALVAENANVYIKQNDVYNDYTSLQPLSMSTIKKIDSSTEISDSSTLYQTIYTPYFYNIFEFENPKLNEITTSSYNNLAINYVNSLKYMWGVRYTDNTNYCLSYNKKVSDEEKEEKNKKEEKELLFNYFPIENYNTLLSSFGNYYYHYFYDETSLVERKSIIKGYNSGTVQKTYYNSLGLLFKNNNYKNIEITSWLNTYIKDNYIYFNVTYNVLNYILQSSGFNKIWNQNNISDEKVKTIFIKNTILPLISINTKNTITIFTKQSDTVNYSNSYISGMEENKNIKIELVSENDNIYARLTPSNIANYTYYIKYNINL